MARTHDVRFDSPGNARPTAAAPSSGPAAHALQCHNRKLLATPSVHAGRLHALKPERDARGMLPAAPVTLAAWG